MSDQSSRRNGTASSSGKESSTLLSEPCSPREIKINRIISLPDLKGQFQLSEDYQHLAASRDEFLQVIKQRMAKLQDRLPQLSTLQLRQARADIVYLRSIISGDDSAIAQAKAGAAYSATH